MATSPYLKPAKAIYKSIQRQLLYIQFVNASRMARPLVFCSRSRSVLVSRYFVCFRSASKRDQLSSSERGSEVFARSFTSEIKVGGASAVTRTHSDSR
jgi:hypothetical protein